jgi:hypothetical protein
MGDFEGFVKTAYKNMDPKLVQMYYDKQLKLTQDLFKLKFGNKKTIKLYRGGGTEEFKKIAGGQKSGTAMIEQNSLSSWTSDRKVAEDFGEVVFEAEIPVSDIYAFYMTHAYPPMSLSEFIVMGGKAIKGTYKFMY